MSLTINTNWNTRDEISFLRECASRHPHGLVGLRRAYRWRAFDGPGMSVDRCEVMEFLDYLIQSHIGRVAMTHPDVLPSDCGSRYQQKLREKVEQAVYEAAVRESLEVRA